MKTEQQQHGGEGMTQGLIRQAGKEMRECMASWRIIDALERIPLVVCLCGSTRFANEFQKQSLIETLKGNIVLSIGSAAGTDDDHFGHMPKDERDRVKKGLEELHLHKIELADEVLILNIGGYIGESTARELAYARELGRTVRFLEPEQAVKE